MTKKRGKSMAAPKSFNFAFYPRPENSTTKLVSDDGFTGSSVPYTDPASGRKGQVVVVPDSVVSEHGATVTTEAAGFFPQRLRGFLILRTDGQARLQVDDWELTAVPVPVEPPPTDPNMNPLQVINYVYESTKPDLKTKEGCGQFTEDCCKELHDKMHNGWGHIRKEPAQNQWNGHAVDAIMLLVQSGGTAPGIYDIIYSTESPEAKPVFNLAGPSEPEKWYYPAAGQ
jgi:hypothetical protein